MMFSYSKKAQYLVLLGLLFSQWSLAIDLNLNLDQSPSTFEPGSSQSNQYQITVSKPDGADDVNSIEVTFSFDEDPTSSNQITSSIEWGCTAVGSSSCVSTSDTETNSDSFTVEFSLKDDNDVSIRLNSVAFNSNIFTNLQFEAEITDLGIDDGSANTDADTTNNVVSDTIDRDSSTDVSLLVSDGFLTYTPGENASYSITVSNAGPSDASSVNVNDINVPTELSITSWSCVDTDGDNFCNTDTGTTDVDTTLDLPAGESQEITVSGVYASSSTLTPLDYEVEVTLGDGDATDPDLNTGDSSFTVADSNSISPRSVITVELDDDVLEYTPGLTGIFTATVTNAGPSDVVGLAVTDSDLATDFASIMWACSTNDTGSCSTSSDNVAIDTTVDLEANSSVEFTIDVDYLSSAVSNPLVYTLTTTKPDGYETPLSNTATDNDNVLARLVKLSLIKNSKEGSYVPDEQLTYSITVLNEGPSDMGGPSENLLTVSDTLDPDFGEFESVCAGGGAGTNEPCWSYCSSDDGVTADINPTNCPSPATVEFGYGYDLSVTMHLAAGSSSEIEVYAQITDQIGDDCDPNTAATREVCNEASAVLTETNISNSGDEEDLTDFVSNRLIIGTDLVVTKTDNLTSASPGNEITYEITVKNEGFINANGVTVSDILPIFNTNDQSGYFVPGSVSWTCETDSQFACCNTQSNVCGFDEPVIGNSGDALQTMVNLGGQSEVLFTVKATISDEASGTIENTATATLPADVEEVDPSNNTATDDDTELVAETDVAIEKALNDSEVIPNTDNEAALEFKLVVSNAGPSFAESIAVTDLLDTDKLDVSTASWNCTIMGIGSCTETGPVTNSDIDTTVDLAVGSEAVFILNVNTKSGSQGKVFNTAAVVASGFDPVSFNNTSSAEYILSGTSQLTVSNSDSKDFAIPGTSTNYTILVENKGPDNVFGAEVENLFPPELTDLSWTCSAFSPIPGDLSFFQSSVENQSGSHMTVSPDGNHVYIASPGGVDFSSQLLTYSRNTNAGAQYGEISLLNILTQEDDDNMGGQFVPGIDSVQKMITTYDGAYIYVYSFNSGESTASISTFLRDNNRLSNTFGFLTHIQTEEFAANSNALDVLISPDQKHVYLTADNKIKRFNRDINDGTLEFIDETSESFSALSFMVMSSAGNYIYAVDDSAGSIRVFSRVSLSAESDFGVLTAQSAQNFSAAEISQITTLISSADNNNIYAVSLDSKPVLAFSGTLDTGDITGLVSYDSESFGYFGTDPNESLLAGSTKILISPDGQHVFVSNSAEGLVVLKRNSEGLLGGGDVVTHAVIGGLSESMISPDGNQVLTTATNGKTLAVFNRRQPDPTFAFIEAEIDQINDPADPAGEVDGLLGAAAVKVSPDGEFVYAAGIGDNAIAVFSRNKTKGSTISTRGEHLTYITSYKNIAGLEDVNSLAITPNGQYLYAGSRDESTLAVFDRSTGGLLSHVTTYDHLSNQIDGLLGISDITVDASSQNLYVVGQFEASVAHYQIDANSGMLTLDSFLANGDLGVSGLAGARSLVLTPDGKQLIVASGIDDSVVVLSRNQSSGAIAFLQHVPGVGDQPMDVAISPDGAHVYVASANDSRLTVLNRNTSVGNTEEAGTLTINTSYIDNVGGFNELLGLRTVVVSPDGEKVYAGAEFDAAITVMDRDVNPNSANYGRLAVVEVRIDDSNGVQGLNQLYELAISKDSKHVYAAGFGDNALAAFVLGDGSSCSAEGTGNIKDVVDIGVNGTLTYSVSATIRSNAINDLVTEARIIPPENFTVIDPVDECADPSNMNDDNCSRDITSLTPETDLSISKSDGKLSAIAGNPIEYEIRVSNNGPSDANSTDAERVMVKDILGSDFEAGSITWTCDAVGSGALSYIGAVIDGENDVEGLNGVSALAFTDNLSGLGPHILATSVLDNGLLAFSFDPMTGELNQVLQGGSYITSAPGISLNGARDILIIDNDVYVASKVDDSLVAFKASNDSGLSLQVVANHQFPDISSGLNQAVMVTASDNGSHVYVAGANDDAIVVFTRNLTTGALSYSNTVTDSNDVLDGVNNIAISQDGFSVYASAYNTNQLSFYRRDAVTGDLDFANLISDLEVELNGISSIQVSPDDAFVYITSAVNSKVYVFSREINIDTAAPEHGQLSWVQTLEQGINGIGGMLNPSAIMISADGRHAYVSAEQSDSVVWFARSIESGKLTFSGLITDTVATVNGLNGALDLAIDNTGKYIFVAASQDDGIAVLSRTSDSYCPASGSGNLVDSLDLDNGVAVDLAVNGQLIFTVNATVAAEATGILLNEAMVYSCDISDGDLPAEGCAGADPDASNNSATDESNLNPTADLMITKTDGVSIYAGLTGATQVTSDDEYLYVAASQDNAISMFSRETDNDGYGDLTYLGQQLSGVDGVSGLNAIADVLLSEDGNTLYAAGSGDNSIVVFNKESNGQLTFLEKHTSGVFGVAGIEGVSSLTLSPDGAHLYASGPLTNSLAVFAINQNAGPDLGKLTFIQQLQNAVNGVSGITSIGSVVVSNDNMHVYVSSETNHSLSLFLRNPNEASVSFGQLSYQVTYSDSDVGLAGLLGASKVILDANDEFLYVLGSVDQSIVVFQRDSETGELTFVEFKQNGTSGVEGLNLAQDLILSRDESSLYVAGQGENALVRFARDSINGTLNFAGVINDGDPLAQPGTFVDGLAGVAGLYISNDDSHLYVVAAQDHSVAVFERDNSSPQPELGSLSLSQVLINGRGGVAPGSELTYLIKVSNAGPSDAENVRVVDIFPSQFDAVTHQCAPFNNADCVTTEQTGNVDVLVNLPAGSSVEIRATGVLRSDAEGVISNTATVSSSTNPDFAVSDPNIQNNTATDDDSVLFVSADLTITKDNFSPDSIPGDQVIYTIRVSNEALLDGESVPADVNNVLVTDLVPEAISDVTWTCDAFPEPGLLDDGDNDPLTDVYQVFTDLDVFEDLVINQLGNLAFAVGSEGGESKLVVYSRDIRTGQLQAVQTVSESTTNIAGLAGAKALVLSPNEQQLYVVSNSDDSISIWSVDSITNELSLEDVLTDGLSGVNGLGGANDVVVSADGLHVYVAGYADNSIAIFNRNSSTGLLTFNDFLAGVDGLAGVYAMTQAGDYIVAVSEANQSIASFKRTPQNGLLVAADVIQDFEVPGSVLVQPQDVLYGNGHILVASYGSDAIAQFDLDADDGMLTFDGAIRQGDTDVNLLEGPAGLAISPTGGTLYVASSVSEAIMLFNYDGVNYLPGEIHYENSLIPELDGINQLVMTATGTHLYGLSDELILAKVKKGSRCTDQGQGQLSDVVDIVSMGHVEYTLTGTVLPTATGLLTNTATALMNGDSVELNPVDNEDSDVDVLVPTSDLSITKDDDLSQVVAGTDLQYNINVFSAGPSAMNVIVEDELPIFPTVTAGFEVDRTSWTCETGRTLQPNDTYQEDGLNGLASGTDIIESPGGGYVYVVSDLGTVSVFSKDTSGLLSLIQLIEESDELTGGTVEGLIGAVATAMDSAGKNLYVVSSTGNQITIFSRNEVSGELDYVRTATTGEDGIFGFSGPIEVIVSPDDTGIYVAAFESDAITVFERDLSTGDLAFVERVKDGFGTIVPESNVIIEITDLVISADGNYLYAAADFSESITVFSRNTATQVLTFETVIRAGDLNAGLSVPPMSGSQTLLITNNGDYVYSLVQDSSSLLRFSRNPSNGELIYQSQLSHGDLNAGSLVSPNDFILTPDGGRMLVTDKASNLISIYDRNTSNGDLTLIDELNVNVSEDEEVAKPVSMVSDGINVYVVLNQQDRLLAIRITADAECQLESELSNTPLVPLYMSPGSAAQILIDGHVHPSARGVINNVANIQLNPGSEDNNLTNNSATDTTEILVQTDVAITKLGPEEAIAGEFIEYQLLLTNSGPSDALNVQVLDMLDAAIVSASWSCSATGRSLCSESGGTGDLDTLVNVTIDGEVNFVITALVDPGFNGNLNNSAEAVVIEAGNNTDSDLTNNTDETSTVITQVANLSVFKTNSVDSVVAGEQTSYEIVVSNSGPSDAPSIIIDEMPGALEQVTWQCTANSGSSCTNTGQGNINDTGYIAAQSQVIYQVQAQVSSSAEGQIVNQALADVIAPVLEADMTNNMDEDIDAITQIADVVVSLEDLIDPYDPASPLDLPFKLEVVNLGPSDARNVQVNLPLQLDVTADTVNVCSVSASGVNCEIGYSTAGQSHEFIVNYRLNPSLTGEIDNLAEATADTFDPMLANNIDTTTTTLANGVDVRVTQNTEFDEVEPGQSITYEITLSNIGSVDSGEVTINETLPDGLIDASWQCLAFEDAACININETGVTGSAELPAGGYVVLTLNATVDPMLADMSETQITNTVEAILITETDYNLMNNSSTVNTPLVFFIFKDGFEGVTP